MLTVMDEVVSPVLHNKVPVAVVDKVEVPQLFTTVTIGAVIASGCTTVKVPVTGPQLLASVTLYARPTPAACVNTPVVLVTPSNV